MTLPTLDLLLRLLCAAGLGAVVGMERETASRGAGARTHALVSLGAALFTMAGAYGFADVSNVARDPARLAAQVAAGVGFIGAGAIIRHGTSVLGITTAATVWLSSAVGVTVAAGGYAAAAVATVCALLVLVVLRAAKPLTRRVGRTRTILEVEYLRGHGTLGPLLRMIDDAHVRLEKLEVEDDDLAIGMNGMRHVTLFVSLPRGANLDRVLETAGNRPEIRTVRVAHGEGG